MSDPGRNGLEYDIKFRSHRGSRERNGRAVGVSEVRLTGRMIVVMSATSDAHVTLREKSANSGQSSIVRRHACLFLKISGFSICWPQMTLLWAYQ